MSYTGEWTLTANEPRECQHPAVHIVTDGMCRADSCPMPESTPESVEFKMSDLVKVAVFIAGVVMFGYFIIGYLSSGPTHDAAWCEYQNNLMSIPGGDDSGIDREAFLKYCVNGNPE